MKIAIISTIVSCALLLGCSASDACQNEISELNPGYSRVLMTIKATNYEVGAFERGIGLIFISKKCNIAANNIIYSKQTFNYLIAFGKKYGTSDSVGNNTFEDVLVLYVPKGHDKAFVIDTERTSRLHD